MNNCTFRYLTVHGGPLPRALLSLSLSLSRHAAYAFFFFFGNRPGSTMSMLNTQSSTCDTITM